MLLASTGTALGGLAVAPAAADAPVPVTTAAAAEPAQIPALELVAQRTEQREMRVSRDRAAREAERLAAERAAAEAAAAQAAAAQAAADAAAKAAADKAAEELAAAKAAAAPEYAPPGTGRLTSGYGSRWGRLHAGIDLAAGVGAPVYAAAAGTVVSAGTESGYGKAMRVRHANGVETLYGHLSGFVAGVGEQVVAGQQIAREGNTGRSTGPHLHFEVRINGSTVNPLTWLRERGVRV